MKTLTNRLVRVGSVGLPGWGPRDPRSQALEAVDGMAEWKSNLF